jgi:hypothetical protein
MVPELLVLELLVLELLSWGCWCLGRCWRWCRCWCAHLQFCHNNFKLIGPTLRVKKIESTKIYRGSNHIGVERALAHHHR